MIPDATGYSDDAPQGIGRDDVVAYLKWLADSPDGMAHRHWLFHAALIIKRDAHTVYVPREERHGDQAI